MSWDATLMDDRGHMEGDWNYTHNCNRMANAVVPAGVLEAGARRWWGKRDDVLARIDAEPSKWGSWWNALDGMDGPAGAAYLNEIVLALEKDPDRFREMNPDNGWGDYESFVAVLRDMRDRVPEWPTTWGVGG